MKLSPLLSEFFSTYKQLELVGIGRFTLDDAGQIHFEQNASLKEDAALVSYIAEKTGRMKSLVSADLDSYLELARQFLNIGKPYLFDGIGTLSKNKFGKLEFTQINAATEKMATEKVDKTSTTETSFTGYEDMLSPKKPGTPASKKIASWLIGLTGLLLAVFGGYLVYNKTKTNSPEPLSSKIEPASGLQQSQQTTLVPDSANIIRDSITVANDVKQPDGLTTYRFIIEKARKIRAINRYNFLKTNFINVQMGTKDSVLFDLYFVLPSMPADTAKKRDSLQRLYGTRGRTTIQLN